MTTVESNAETRPGSPDGGARGCIEALMVSTSYPADLDDWRGLFMRHLADALGRRRDLRLRLWAPPGDTHPDIAVDPPGDERAWLAGLMRAGGIAHLYRSDRLRGPVAAAKLMRLLRRAYRRNLGVDVLHVNWLQNALPLPARDRRPLLATVLGTDMQLLRLPLVRPLLRRVFRHRRVLVCPNAEWMVPILHDVFGDVAGVEFVPFGIDPAWYDAPRLPATPDRWLAVTRLTRAKLGPLFDWCAPHFADGQRELHLFGPMQESVAVPDWVHYHGPAGPAALRRTWFPSARGLITLSRHAEGRPQVMLEAMAAGLPIIASSIPAHASFLEHGRTGWLCDAAAGLAPALAALEDGETGARIGAAARDWVAGAVGTWDDCADRYMRMYRRLLEADPR